jgi:2-polyprenyl-3-methyl-5-hydroxy-6-metoxy-1,4-benzoquinol methylase
LLPDKSNGYEAVAGQFLAGRGKAGIVGIGVVREWARTLPRGASVLDIGCGSGIPISNVLVQEGLAISGVDASAAMITAFRHNFPGVPMECAAVEDSTFFGAEYDGVIAWGLMFLLSSNVQRALIGKVSRVLKSGGRFLFTAPKQACTWPDAMTELQSSSLGLEVYREILQAESMVLVGEQLDEGENFYYFASKT